MLKSKAILGTAHHIIIINL